MSIPDCFVKFKKFADENKLNISSDDMRNLAASLAEKQAGNLSSKEFNALATELYTNSLDTKAVQNRAAKMINLEKKATAISVVSQKIEGQSSVQNLVHWLVGGSQRIGDGLNYSVRSGAAGLEAKWLGGLYSVMSKEDRMLAESNYYVKETLQEMVSLSKGEPIGSSGVPAAGRVAQYYNGMLKVIFDTKAAFSPYLGKIQDYFFRATHSQDKISAAGWDAWFPKAWKTYGEKSFPELSPADKIHAFRQVFNNIVKGTYTTEFGSGVESGDVMAKISRGRTLIPSDWESFHEYNTDFGTANLHQTMVRVAQQAAWDVAVINKFGSVPKDTVNAVVKYLSINGDADTIAELKRSKSTIESYTQSAVTRTDAPASGSLARLIRGSMAWASLSKNGAVLLRSQPDLANAATFLSSVKGTNYAGELASIVSDYMKNFGSLSKDDAVAHGSELYLLSHSMSRNLLTDLGPELAPNDWGGKAEGALGNLLQLQGKLSGIDRHVRSLSYAFANNVSRYMGQMTKVPFEELPPSLASGLKRYGITGPEWKALSNGVENWTSSPEFLSPEMGDMSRMLNTDGIKNISDKSLETYAREKGMWKGRSSISSQGLIRARTELELKVGSLINDGANVVTISPTAADRALMYKWAPDSSTASGAAIRALMQFKTAMVRNYDLVRRTYYSNGGGAGGYSAVAMHIAAVGFFTALGELAKQMITTGSVEDLSDPANSVRFAAKMGVQSGGLGIFGETLLSELGRGGTATDKAGRAALSLMGPTASTAFKVGGVALEGADQLFPSNGPSRNSFGKDFGSFLTSNINPLDLVYTRAAMNYFLLNGVHEYFDPGFMDRQDRSMARRGQEQRLLKGSAF